MHVYTGDKSGAGTDADVFVVLKGSHGDSGERELKTSQQHTNKFERNQLDTFEIEAVDLGDLESVRVWHNNKGIGAAWYLDRIEVEDDAGQRCVFPCDKWLSKSEGDKEVGRCKSKRTVFNIYIYIRSNMHNLWNTGDVSGFHEAKDFTIPDYLAHMRS